jgi:hypothetical protein
MKQNKIASGAGTRRVRAQRFEQKLAIKVREMSETPQATPTGINHTITDNQAWIGRYASGEYYRQNISGTVAGMSDRPTLELAPTASIVRAFDFHGATEARRRLDIIERKNRKPMFYEVGELILRQDKWSILLIALPSVTTADSIRREQESVRSRLDAPPFREHEELIIGSLKDMATAEIFQATLTAHNAAVCEPMLMFGASRIRGL